MKQIQTFTKENTLFKLLLLAGLLSGIAMLSGCASQGPLISPCPNFGAQCVKRPVNTWNGFLSRKDFNPHQTRGISS